MKKSYLVILIATFFLGCNQNTQKKEAVEEAKVEIEAAVSEALLVVNYELENMSLEDHAKLGAEVAPNFTSENVIGLIGKTFIGNIDKGVFLKTPKLGFIKTILLSSLKDYHKADINLFWEDIRQNSILRVKSFLNKSIY